MSRRKYIWIVTLILLLCALLLSQLTDNASQGVIWNGGQDGAGGASPNEPLTPGEERIELHVAVFMNAEEFRLLSEWNRLHESNHPSQTFILTNLTKPQLYSELKNPFADTRPDIVLLDNIWINELAALGLLSHRTVEMIDAERYVPQMIEQMRWNGYIWAIPRDIDPYVALLNRPLLEGDEGRQLPAAPEQWLEEHERLAELDDYIGFQLDEHDPLAIVSAIWAVGGDWVTGDNTMHIAGLIDSDSPMARLLTHERPFFQHSSATDEAPEGKTAAAAVSRLSDWLMQRSPDDELALRAAVTGEDGGLWLAGTSFAVSSKAANPAEAFAWINAMTEQTRQLQLMRHTGTLPVFQAAYTTVDFRMLPQSELIKGLVEAGRSIAADAQLRARLDAVRDAWHEWKTAATAFGEESEPTADVGNGGDSDHMNGDENNDNSDGSSLQAATES